MNEQGYLSCRKASDMVGVHRSTLYRWIKANRVSAIDMHGVYYVQWESLVRCMGAASSVLGLDKDVCPYE